MDSIRVLSLSSLPDGTLCAEVPCADYSALKRLPHTIEVCAHQMRRRVILSRTGWDSDRCVAFFKDNVLYAVPA